MKNSVTLPMIDLFKDRIGIEKFVSDSKSKWVKKQVYDLSYPEFLKYFDGVEPITKHHLIIAINFTYGWMPTAFKFKSEDFKEPLTILNMAKKGIIPTVEQLEVLKGLLNNSLVGTSKLLHFINPNRFAIWDSRVYRYLTGNEAYANRIGDCESYLSFLELCEYLIDLKEFDEVHNHICDTIGYQMTRYRTVELNMYLNGGKEDMDSKPSIVEELILEAGADGGSVKLLRINSLYVYTTDESTLKDFLPELSDEELKSRSDVFKSFPKAMKSLLERYSIFRLYPLEVNPEYKVRLLSYYKDYCSKNESQENWNKGNWDRFLFNE